MEDQSAYPTAEELRALLRLSLKPSYGPARTVRQLADITLGNLLPEIRRHAPELERLLAAVEAADAVAESMRQAYADGLEAWIKADPEPRNCAPVPATPDQADR